MTICMETVLDIGRLSISQEEVKPVFRMQKVWFNSGDLTIFFLLVSKVFLIHFNLKDKRHLLVIGGVSCMTDLRSAGHVCSPNI